VSENQRLKAGDHSTNVQAAVVNIGATYTEMREIAQDVFRSNFLELKGEAIHAAESAANRVTDKFLAELQSRAPEAIGSAKSPDMQRALFHVQEAAAFQQDEDLEEVLVDMLVDRTTETGRSLRQLVLNEALITAPKLTDKQINTLAVIFYLRRVVHFPLDGGAGFTLPPGELRRRLTHYLSFDPADLAITMSDLRHLEYAGCLTIQLGYIGAGEALLKKYPGSFFEPVPEESVPDELRSAFARSDGGLLPALDFNEEALLAGVGLTPDQGQALRDLVASSRMSNEKALAVAVEDGSLAARVLTSWDETELKHCELNSVGVAIGHAKQRRAKGLDAPVEVFLAQ